MQGEMVGTGNVDDLDSKSLAQQTAVALAGIVFNLVTGFGSVMAVTVKHFGWVSGIKQAWFIVNYSVIETFKNMYFLCFGKGIMLGPKETGEVFATFNPEQVLLVFGILSIVMALVNLLPFPALDGSLPLLVLMKKTKLTKKLAVFLWIAGFIILMVLQALVFTCWLFQ